jgi:predicted ATPase
VAAVCGFSFEARALCVEDSSIEHVLVCLRRATAYNLVHEADDTFGHYEFVHGLVREVLYEDLDAKRRASLHNALAKRIELLADPGDERRLALLAHHLVRALPFGDAQAAIECLLRAGVQALHRYAYEAAWDYLEQGVRILDVECPNAHEIRVELLLHLAHAQEGSGSIDTAWSTIESATRAAQPLSPLRGIVRVALESGHG